MRSETVKRMCLASQCPNQGRPDTHQVRQNSVYACMVFLDWFMSDCGCIPNGVILREHCNIDVHSQPPLFFLSVLVTDLSSCNIVNGYYRYMGDLLALEAIATGSGPAPFVPATPLKPTAWHNYLVRQPDQHFAQ